MCVINRECKIKPIHDYYKSYREDYDIVQYVGIAADESKRLARLKKNQISLLNKYGYTEKMAYRMCEKAGLLSPIYENGTRGGCWFCMNAKLPQYIKIRRNHLEMWEDLRALSLTPNLCSYGFKYGKTLQEVEKEMDRIEEINEKQIKLF